MEITEALNSKIGIVRLFRLHGALEKGRRESDETLDDIYAKFTRRVKWEEYCLSEI
jgi:hypothetical protein